MRSPLHSNRQAQAVGALIARLPLAEAAVAGLFFAAALTAIVVTRSAGGAAIIWPGNAIAAALLIRMPGVRWITIAVALFGAGLLADTLGSGDPPALAAAMALANLAEIGVTAWLFRSVIQFPLPNLSVTQAAQMAVIFAAAIPALTACLGGWIVHDGLGAPLWPATWDWWSSSFIGACLFGPPICLYSSGSARRLVSRRFLAQNLTLTAICLASVYVSMRFLGFPFVVIGVSLMIAAFRVGGFGAAVLSALSGLLVIALWVLGIRPPGAGMLQHAVGVIGLPIVAIAATILPPTAVGLASDERRKATKALRLNERRFRDSMEHSPIGTVLADLGGMWMTTNAALERMLGYSAAEFRALSASILAHPEDRPDIDRRLQLLRNGDAPTYEADRRFRHKDGSWISARVAVSLVRDEAGRPLHLIGHIESVDARKRAERELADERQRLVTTLRAIADAVITVDVAMCITYVNAAAEELLGHTIDQIRDRQLDDVMILTDARTLRPTTDVVGRCVVRGEVVRREEPCVLHRPDGSVRFVTDVASPVFSADGQVAGTVVVLHDATGIRERDRELSHRATHDVLTGLVNRFEFERRAREVFERARHVDRGATLLVVDLDRFKTVNDSGGHAAGDAVLRRVGEVLMSSVRHSDTVARIGGDEFAVLLDRCGTDRAQAIASQILRALNPLAVEWNGATHTIGASVGLATILKSHADAAAWMTAADQACYEAKRDGRGQSRVAQAKAT